MQTPNISCFYDNKILKYYLRLHTEKLEMKMFMDGIVKFQIIGHHQANTRLSQGAGNQNQSTIRLEDLVDVQVTIHCLPIYSWSSFVQSASFI